MNLILDVLGLKIFEFCHVELPIRCLEIRIESSGESSGVGQNGAETGAHDPEWVQ